MPASTLRGRIPGQIAMFDVVATQSSVPERSRLARFFGRSPLTPETKTGYRTALGELLVGDMLDNLGPRWDVLHVVPIVGGAKDVDHLVIGPPGVFAILTENFPGQEIRVNGDSLNVGSQHFDEIAIARDLGERVAALLGDAASRPVVVTPLLVIVNPTRLSLRAQPAGVTVIGSRQLLHYLEKLDRTLSGADVASISDSADRAATWRTEPAEDQDVLRLCADFDALRSSVEGATQLRAFWAVMCAVALSICAWAITSAVVSHLLTR